MVTIVAMSTPLFSIGAMLSVVKLLLSVPSLQLSLLVLRVLLLLLLLLFMNVTISTLVYYYCHETASNAGPDQHPSILLLVLLFVLVLNA